MPLTVKQIESARPQSKPWKLADERGLYLLISSNGSKRWHLRYSFHGKKKKISFGPFPDISLKSARAKRDEARALVAEGVDPLERRREQKLKTKLTAEHSFASVAREGILQSLNH